MVAYISYILRQNESKIVLGFGQLMCFLLLFYFLKIIFGNFLTILAINGDFFFFGKRCIFWEYSCVFFFIFTKPAIFLVINLSKLCWFLYRLFTKSLVYNKKSFFVSYIRKEKYCPATPTPTTTRSRSGYPPGF